ncbi:MULTISPECIES: NAD(P)/FAD-dependent oxidoreductase [Acidianus]|uniref:FAD-dependent oxidoreductase n=1 Tax=Candidatus Acidianus copahuensis TaxID=1160895 RepID=A0A031LTL6_9CREN|nr:MULTISPECIES: NAD(P)/FAD-dependent oxidoreductase [Acidianus]EZQ11136.1 FAD-dependent oxidoreductase [Candidatus Acidianus copahuensis]NON63663.1 NAD(P)/FAD-dependent oxidoreductase [Acidianus sp. RZ1]
MRIAVIGAGPAGISLGYFLKGTKNEVTIYEGLDTLGKKPCAWGVLKGIENYVTIPKESIISEIKGFKIFYDNKLIYDIRGRENLGYIVDKPLFLEKLSEGLDLKRNSKVQIEGNKIKVNGKNEGEEFDKIVLANGHYSLSKDLTIPAIQFITDHEIDNETVEMYFYSDLLGYGWVFPEREGSKIGIGGYANVDFLKEKLKTLVKGNTRAFQGARVSDFGVLEERLNGNYIGEALGTVYAITGEGIRPSIITSKIFAESLLEEKDFKKEFKKSKLYWTLQKHAEIIQYVKRSNNIKALEKVLMKSDPDMVLKFAMGDFDKIDLLKMFGRMIFG